MPDIPIRVHRGGEQYGVRFQDQRLPDDYFYRGVWRADGAGANLRTHTCVVCGHRSATWDHFKAHRAACAASGQADPELEALKAAARLEEEQEQEEAADDVAPPEVAA